MLLPGSSWLHPNVPNARGKGQPSHRAGEPFRHGFPPFRPSRDPAHRTHRPERMLTGPPVDWPYPGAWCNGSTTGSGPVSRGSNPCAPARGRRDQKGSDLRDPIPRANPPAPRRGSSRTGPTSVRLRFVTRRHRPMSTYDVDTPMSALPYGPLSDRSGVELEIFDSISPKGRGQAAR
jgi:hypothetical protein